MANLKAGDLTQKRLAGFPKSGKPYVSRLVSSREIHMRPQDGRGNNSRRHSWFAAWIPNGLNHGLK
jgi:hypothetical protein